jgi:hypothetical protein
MKHKVRTFFESRGELVVIALTTNLLSLKGFLNEEKNP